MEPPANGPSAAKLNTPLNGAKTTTSRKEEAAPFCLFLLRIFKCLTYGMQICFLNHGPLVSLKCQHPVQSRAPVITSAKGYVRGLCVCVCVCVCVHAQATE